VKDSFHLFLSPSSAQTSSFKQILAANLNPTWSISLVGMSSFKLVCFYFCGNYLFKKNHLFQYDKQGIKLARPYRSKAQEL
jgi:hypothetical protein